VLSGDQLAARIGRRLRAGFAALSAAGMLAVPRRRRARVTAAVTTLSMATAAIAAAAFAPGPAAPATRDSAYVAGHATRALTPVLPGIIFSMRWTTTRPNLSVMYVWARGGQMRSDLFMSGRPVIERGDTTRGTTGTAVFVSYQDRKWSRRTFNVGKPSAPSGAARGSFACDSASKAFGIVFNPSDLLASLRSWESCGWLKADGTATVDGVTAVRLTIPFNSSSPNTWYVSQATYLPVRATVTHRGKLLAAYDFRWLPPTRANLAKLALPVPPRGFTRVGG
jgi:hypothetical protein